LVTVDVIVIGSPGTYPVASRSSVAASLGCGKFPATVSVTAMVAHVFGPAVQLPAWQVSELVQLLPSLHDVPFIFAGFEQVPVAGLHVPAS
jgi:hypothetical protein